MERHASTGGRFLFVTLTLRHTKAMPLALTLNAALKAYQSMQNLRAWRQLKEDHGVVGAIRSVEVTYSTVNGWHPHIHAVFFVPGHVTDETAEQWRSVLFGLWSKRVTQLGAGMPTETHGVIVKAVDGDGAAVAAYIAKLQEPESPTDSPAKGHDLAKELARSDTKTARSKTSIVPFQLLDDDKGGLPISNAERERLWFEYVKATKGRRAITWTKGLRAQCGLDDDKTDEEILDETETGKLVILINSEAYRGALQDNPDMMLDVLRAVAAKHYDKAERLSWGVLVTDASTGEVGVSQASVMGRGSPPASSSDERPTVPRSGV